MEGMREGTETANVRGVKLLERENEREAGMGRGRRQGKIRTGQTLEIFALEEDA